MRWFRWSGPSIRRRARAAGDPLTVGYLDHVEAGWALGWARRPRQPDRRVRVRVLVDGRAVAEDVADQHRPDLAAAGHGDGRHGFAVALPGPLLDGRARRIEVVDAETGARLRAMARRRRLADGPDPVSAALDRLFDPGFYQAQAGHVPFPLDHYRETGWRQGLDPHPLFSTRHYLAHNRTDDPVTGDPLTHFAERGQFARAWCHPLLDPDAPPVASSPARRGPGRAAGLDGGDRTGATRARHPLLAYLDAGGSPADPIGRLFSDADYRARYPDVDDGGLPPLLHYLRYGRDENRRPHPDFDPDLFARVLGLDLRGRGPSAERRAERPGSDERAPADEPFTRLHAWLAETARPGRAAPSPGSGPPAIAAPPAVSVIVLNHGKSVLTLQCLCVLAAHTDTAEAEVIVVDNGSPPEDFVRLARHARGVTLVRLDANRGFGEGNNVGAEHARGRLLVFLNNDAFVRPGWLAPLRAAIEADATVGAAGAKLLYPDGRLQEAGALVTPCGTAVQRGKGLDPRSHDRAGPVDYCSAAALMVRADAFRAALGFDLAFDPAYYEDADLCLKLRAMGLSTVYAPGSEVVHLEHATSADAGLDLRLHDIVDTNRLKFVARWGDHLAGLPGARPPAPARAPAGGPPAEPRARPARTAALYTPYALTPGGGERYLLTIAEALRDSHRVTLLTPDRYSRLRLLTVGRDLGLDLDRVAVATLTDGEAGAPPAGGGPVDLFVCMANEVLPPMRGLGRVNLYHCQFPFPLHPSHYGRGWRHLAGYGAVLVNSAFTAGHFAAQAAALGITPPPVRVLHPPVPRGARAPTRGAGGVARILSVGRFSPGGHAKRQDLMIPALARLLDGAAGPVELHLAGAVGGESAARVHLRELVEAARGLPVTFHPNATAARIAELYAGADVYWHLTGAGEDPARHPERFEHFGIALAEAMGAGAVPVALGLGGPAEIVADGHDGVLIAAGRELAPATAGLLADRPRLARLSAAARTRAAAFNPEAFTGRLRALLAELEGAPDPATDGAAPALASARRG